MVSLSATSSARPPDCARASTGARPPTDTRFGLSNVADNAGEPRDSRILRMSFCLDRCDLRQATSSLLRGHLCIPTRSNTSIRWWIEAQVQPNVQDEGRASFGHDCRPHQQRAPGGGSVFMTFNLAA